MQIFTTFFSLLIFCSTAIAQNIYPELNYKFSLFKKDVKEVKIIQADVLKEVWKINAENKTITVFTMKARADFEDYTFDEENMPSLDENYFISEESTWYFHKKGRLDSVNTTQYNVAFFGDFEKNGPYGDDMVGKVAQTHRNTSYCYSRKCLAVVKYWHSDEVFTGIRSVTTYNCEKRKSTKYTINKGEITNELLYDKKGRLIEIRSGDRLLSGYEYDQNGNLTKSFSSSFETNFTYTPNGLIETVTKTEGRPMPYEYVYD